MHKISAILLVLAALSCKGKSQRSQSGFNDGGEVVDPKIFNEASREVASIEDASVDRTLIYTEGTGTPNCVTFSVTLKDKDDKPVEGAVVEFTAQSQEEESGVSGKFNEETPLSNAEGKVEAVFCAGRDPLKVVLIAKVVNKTKNSAEIRAINKGTYKFVYERSSQDGPLSGDTAGSTQAADIQLNFWDAGPEDCVDLFFRLTVDEEPISGKSLVFKTPYDMPLGVKLAERADNSTLYTDPDTGRKRAIFNATSSSDGRYRIPACAGSALGSFSVSADFEDESGKTVLVESSTIFISGGLPIQSNFTSTYDNENAKTLQGFFNTNSAYKISTKIQTNSLNSGDAIITSPISVSAETGRVSINNSGQLKDGLADFTIQALHMNNYYAYPTTAFEGYPDALSRCDPQQIGDYLTANSLTSFKYYDLAKNWRSTLVYQTQGQEYYFDRNGNGSYDGGGDGFWDKNQNGVWDAGIDELTFDQNNNGFNASEGEYFIDLPSPFIDVDEDMSYQQNVDILLTDSYVAPNGSRDKSGLIWRYDVYPIYMGMSEYGLLREGLKADPLAALDPSVSGDVGGTYFGINFGLPLARVTDENLNEQKTHVFAHGLCGNILPGGTKLELSAEKISGGKKRRANPRLYIHF